MQCETTITIAERECIAAHLFNLRLFLLYLSFFSLLLRMFPSGFPLNRSILSFRQYREHSSLTLSILHNDLSMWYVDGKSDDDALGTYPWRSKKIKEINEQKYDINATTTIIIMIINIFSIIITVSFIIPYVNSKCILFIRWTIWYSRYIATF